MVYEVREGSVPNRKDWRRVAVLVAHKNNSKNHHKINDNLVTVAQKTVFIVIVCLVKVKGKWFFVSNGAWLRIRSKCCEIWTT